MVGTIHRRRPRSLLALFVCTLLVIVTVSSGTTETAHARSNTIWFNGKNIYLNGINLAWMDYAEDFGGTHQPNWESRWWNAFADLKAHGVNSTRIWVHTDGRASPNFDSNGYVTGLSSQFYGDMWYVLDQAKANNVGVIFVLWAHEIDGRYGTNHLDMFTDPAKIDSYINNAMIPMINTFDSHPALLAWEVMNEPEYMLQSEGGVYDVSTYEMSRFMGKLAGAAQGITNKYVTAGASFFKYMCDKSTNGFDCRGNIFSDSALQSASGDWRASLDFYQTHYYSEYFMPWEGRGPGYYLDDQKPVLIGEFRNNDAYGIWRAIDDTYALGYMGHMPFQYNPDPCCGSFEDSKYALQNFRYWNSSIVDIDISNIQWP
jgi:hypothetical protein